MSTVIVYVHGLWQRGAEAAWLRRRLARAVGAQTRSFSYPSVKADAEGNAAALLAFLSGIEAQTLHLVGHSLGGLMILRLFESNPHADSRLPPGRIVLLGSPVRGSLTAQKLARLSFGRWIMGRSVGQELLSVRDRVWPASRQLGLIAGSSPYGLGRLVGRLAGPSDGTVMIEETQIAGATDRVVIPTTHTGMLFSAAVAAQAGVFLYSGRFNH